MKIENIQPIESKEAEVAEPPSEQVPKAETKIVVTPEDLEKAKDTIFETLDIEPDENLDNFKDKLKEATKSLPRYQQIAESLASVDDADLPHELFKLIKKSADEKQQEDENATTDGVLIKAMKQGKFECAGRTLVASTLLQERGIDHAVVTAPGHALVLVEVSPDTLAYFDANNNLYFTLPKSALKGYEGTGTSSECKIEDYTPREKDIVDGVNPAYSHFITMPPDDGRPRQYLGNVAAAFHGNEDFINSSIVKDEKAEEAVHQITEKILGKSQAWDNFHTIVENEKLVEKDNTQNELDIKNVVEILQNHPEENDFIEFFTKAIDGNFGERQPYVKGGNKEDRKKHAKRVWDFLQTQEAQDMMRTR